MKNTLFFVVTWVAPEPTSSGDRRLLVAIADDVAGLDVEKKPKVASLFVSPDAVAKGLGVGARGRLEEAVVSTKEGTDLHTVRARRLVVSKRVVPMDVVFEDDESSDVPF